MSFAMIILTMIFVPIATKVYKIDDAICGIIGAISLMLMMLLRGTILSIAGYYVSAIAGCLAPLHLIGKFLHACATF